jgi:hypothetical protein
MNRKGIGVAESFQLPFTGPNDFISEVRSTTPMSGRRYGLRFLGVGTGIALFLHPPKCYGCRVGRARADEQRTARQLSRGFQGPIDDSL